MTDREVLRTGACEIELGNKKNRVFLKVYFNPFEIWIDLHGLPRAAILCMMFDGTPYLESLVRSTGNETRKFVNIEWVINEWGGDQELVDAIKKRKQMIIDKLPILKEKYGNS